ncbi:MAG: thioesterase family protein [Planctomycetota bacterium]
MSSHDQLCHNEFSTDRRTFAWDVRVRYDECDPMGFVHHSNFLRYLELGRTEFLRAAGGCYRKIELGGLLIVVVSANQRFRSPAKYDDVLTILTTVAQVTTVKIMHEYRIIRREADGSTTLIASAELTLAMLNRDGKIQPIPAALRI